jgi:metal-responsive CopG/Arc/MetJ family transcriptional regulator
MAAKTNMKLDRALYERASLVSKAAGYSSVEEFIEHALEQELARHEEATDREEAMRQLRGLGYLE